MLENPRQSMSRSRDISIAVVRKLFTLTFLGKTIGKAKNSALSYQNVNHSKILPLTLNNHINQKAPLTLHEIMVVAWMNIHVLLLLAAPSYLRIVNLTVWVFTNIKCLAF